MYGYVTLSSHSGGPEKEKIHPKTNLLCCFWGVFGGAAKPPPFPEEYIPEWGGFQFLVPFLRPKAPEGPGPEKASFTIRPGGGCNDLAFSGHVAVAVLTACAWQVKAVLNRI